MRKCNNVQIVIKFMMHRNIVDVHIVQESWKKNTAKDIIKYVQTVKELWNGKMELGCALIVEMKLNLMKMITME